MKKLLTVLLCLFLVSCQTPGKQNKVNTRGSEYVNKLADYKSREKDPGNTNPDDPEFDAFLDQVFRDGMATDYMTMHFSVIDYRSFGLEKPPVDLGEIAYGLDEESFSFFEEQLKDLQSFDFAKLSLRQQYDYEALEYSIYETLASLCYYQYSFLFSTGSCLPENLISNFTDYTFYDEESVEDYLTCLADIGRYFDEALAYTKAQADDGLGPVDAWIDYTQDSCKGVLNKTDDNAFIVTFDERIDALDFLDDAKKQAYKERNRQIFNDVVVPAYSKISKELENYRGKFDLEDYVLCDLDKDYARLTYMLDGSSNKPIDTVFEELTDNLWELEAQIISGLYTGDSLDHYMAASNGQIEDFNLINEECLDYLKEKLVKYYPDLGPVEYDIQELDPDTAPATAIAYYWPAPLDNHDQNIIRTNPNNMRGGIEAYGTLAHEGFPGHLYQHVYYYKTKPHNFRSVIGFTGYDEGWAVNAQKYCFKFPGLEDEYAEAALYFDDTNYFPIYTIIDIGTNYYGWSANDIVDYFKKESRFVSFDKKSAEQMRDLMIEMAGVYVPYAVGYSNFAVLENKARKALGDKFDIVSYHDAVLRNGPLPFNILEDAVDAYIKTNQ